MYSQTETAERVAAAGEKKAKNDPVRLLLLAILAGIFVALSGAGANTAACLIENAAVAKLVGALVFPVGLGMILIAGGELFTGNCLIIVSVLEGRASPLGMFKNWFFVYVGNFIGSIIVSFMCSYCGQYALLGGAVARGAASGAIYKVSLGFWPAFGLAVLCNVVVCTAVWMAYGSNTAEGKAISIYLPVMLFVLAGLEHCVANAYFVSAGIFANLNPAYSAALEGLNGLESLTVGNFLFKSMLPSTLGNIVGGVLLGACYWYTFLKKDSSRSA